MTTVDDFTVVLSQIVNDILLITNTKRVSNDWSQAILFGSFSGDGSSTGKLRISLKSGEWDKSQHLSRDIDNLIENTWAEMFKKNKKIWYGFKLTVYPDGNHKIEYNYDPNCIDDPNFFDF